MQRSLQFLASGLVKWDLRVEGQERQAYLETCPCRSDIMRSCTTVSQDLVDVKCQEVPRLFTNQPITITELGNTVWIVR